MPLTLAAALYFESRKEQSEAKSIPEAEPQIVSRTVTRPGNPLFSNLPNYTFSNDAEFSAFCRSLVEAYKPHLSGDAGRMFLFKQAKIARGGSNIIKTAWGGVDVERYRHPEVHKYLVVREGGFLAYEMHEQKIETLELMQGKIAFLLRRKNGSETALSVMTPGQSVHLEPGDEHCVIALEPSVLFEHSVDPKGMDKDLIFLFTPQ